MPATLVTVANERRWWWSSDLFAGNFDKCPFVCICPLEPMLVPARQIKIHI